MIQVTFEAIGFLKKFGEKDQTSMSFDKKDSTTTRKLADLLGIPPKYPLLFLVNSKTKKDDYVLADGDHIVIMMPIAGGSR